MENDLGWWEREKLTYIRCQDVGRGIDGRQTTKTQNDQMTLNDRQALQIRERPALTVFFFNSGPIDFQREERVCVRHEFGGFDWKFCCFKSKFHWVF